MNQDSGSGYAAKLYVHSFSYRFRLRNDPMFTFVDFIRDAAERGFGGVNVSVYGPKYEHLSDTSPAYLRRARAILTELGIGIDIESNYTDPERLRGLLDIGRELGAGLLRTLVKGSPQDANRIEDAIANLRAIVPVAEDFGIPIALENHEDVTAREVAEILSAVDSPWIGALFDYGNSMVHGEDPSEGLDALLPWVMSAHLKDQLMIASNASTNDIILGLPIGSGGIPIRSFTSRLLESGIRRICFENTWAYQAPAPHQGPNDRRGSLFDPIELPQHDVEYCIDTFPLNGRDLVETEAVMLDRSIRGLNEILTSLPIRVPSAPTEKSRILGDR
jgi:sugar phosphate isomerase/epimerase